MCIATGLVRRDTKGTKYQSPYRIVPCGKCPECLSKRALDWTFRLEQEALESTSALFVTLTYNDKYLPRKENQLMTLEKKDLRNFFKRLRNRTEFKIKYYACGEYGEQYHRPHYHAIIFNLPLSWAQDPQNIRRAWSRVLRKGNQYMEEQTEELGFIDVGIARTGSFNYVAKYIMKGAWKQEKDILDEETGEIFKDNRTKQFSWMSKNMGLGWLTPAMEKHVKETLEPYVMINGVKRRIPRYYMDRINFTGEERRILSEKKQDFIEEANLINDYRLDVERRKDVIRAAKRKEQLTRNKL